MIRKGYLSFILILFIGVIDAQEISLVSGTFELEKFDIESINSIGVKPHYLLAYKKNGISQFELEEWENNGLTFGGYLPQDYYYVKINPVLFNQENLPGDVSYYQIKSEYKYSKELSQGIIPERTLLGTTHAFFNLNIFGNKLDDLTLKNLSEIGAELVRVRGDRIRVVLEISRWSELAEIEQVLYIEPIDPQSEPLNLLERTNHRSSYLSSDSENGLQFHGDNISVLMTDDGAIGEHIDFTGRVDHSYCNGCSSDLSYDHGDHVAGTIMGAGNLDQRVQGMAKGVNLFVENAWNNDMAFDDVPSLVASDSLVITSRSFGNGCGGDYNSWSREFDQETRQLSTILHICSAGNYGNDDCHPNGAIVGWFSQGGGEQQAKNTVSVGNLSHLDALNSSSSKGPAEDGRIKPDICGVGTGVTSTLPNNDYGDKTGTSMSCPGVSGTMAQLNQAYRELNGGALPKSALMKAILMNTADDIGNPGPDFSHGYGRINARRAYETMLYGSYFQETVSDQGSDDFVITVPSDAKEIKIMLYWHDWEAQPSAAKMLVNDLNLTVEDPDGIIFEPWVLDHSANLASLTADAVRGVDNRNNVEQVTIDNPTPGQYTIHVEGFDINVGPQEYFVVYEVNKEQLAVVYPNGGEGLTAGTNYIRWDANKDTIPFTIDFSSDNGSTWSTIGTAPSQARVYAWPTANITSGKCQLRITRGSISDITDNSFSIHQPATNLQVAWSCPDSLRLDWTDPYGTSTAYEVSMLGSKYMDSVAYTTNNWAVIPISSNEDVWLSVTSYGADSARSRRAIAIHKVPGQFGCTWSDPVANFETTCSLSALNECFTVNNLSVNTDASSTYLWYFPTGTPSTSTDENPLVCFSDQGLHDAALVVQNSAGSDSIYMANFVSVQPAQGLSYLEGFEYFSSFNNTEHWTTNATDVNFVVTNQTGHNSSQSAFLRNFIQDPGNVSNLISGPIDLSSLDESAGDFMTLSFRFSYKKRNTEDTEWLKLWVRDACESNWLVRKTIQGNNLSTSEWPDDEWEPSIPTQWTTVHVTTITSQFWTEAFQMKFEFISDGGNNFYLDNINIYPGDPSTELVGLTEVVEIEELELFPNPTDGELNLGFNVLAQQAIQFKIVDVNGKELKDIEILAQPGHNLVQIDTQSIEAGTYFITIQSGLTSEVHKFVKH